VVARGAKGQSRTYRRAPSSVQNAAYRRLTLAILGFGVATLADQLRARFIRTSIATRNLVPFPATASEASSTYRRAG